MTANREGAERNIRAAIGNRRETFMLVSLTLTGDGYRATFSQGPLTVRRQSTKAPQRMSRQRTSLRRRRWPQFSKKVRSEFGGPGRGGSNGRQEGSPMEF